MPVPTPVPTTACDRYQGGWQHSVARLHENRDGWPPRALPDLCEPHTDRDSAALRSAERDILGNDTTPLAAPRVPKPSIKSSYRAHIPGLSMGMKLPAGQTPPCGHVADKASIPPCLKVSHQLPAQFRLEFRRLVSREDQDSGQTCTSPLSPPVLRTALWLHSTHATGTRVVGKLWFREGPAQAGQVGTDQEARPRRCMERPGRPASQPTTGLNPANRDGVPGQSDAQESSLVRRQEWATAGAERLRFAGCGFAVP